MKSRTIITAAALLVLSGFAANAQQRVSVIGCPLPGIEARCLVIRGSDNVTYNISDTRQRPEIGQRAIRVTGTTTKKASYCQQGVVLTNIAWSYTDQKCANR